MGKVTRQVHAAISEYEQANGAPPSKISLPLEVIAAIQVETRSFANRGELSLTFMGIPVEIGGQRPDGAFQVATIQLWPPLPKASKVYL